ncbi:MAG: DUF4065 domain-containing protein [Succinivibrionaceae bacterium]|nr:DUF4065 domain-containing protein [Succinivibrionaceae bacterium]
MRTSEYTASEIAAYVVKFAFDETEPATNLALQKLLYFFQYASLVVLNKPLNSTIQFEAWNHGPVVREVYSNYRINGPCLLFPDNSIDNAYNEMKDHFRAINKYVMGLK